MHRELDQGDDAFARPSDAGLYAFTALLGLLIARDLWPLFANTLTSWGLELPTAQNTFLGYRYALIAAVLGGARILYRSLDDLARGKLGTDLAIALACIAAIRLGEPLVAAEVVFIALAGECLEAFTFARTQRGIRKLLEVFPRKCWLLRDGAEVPVETNTVRVGDRVRIKPGKKVPVDGVIVEGESSLDTSPLTGESLPVEKRIGDEVLAGSINQLGVLTVEARQVAEQTVAGRVIEVTARALKEKPPLQRQADRFARYFLPVVLALTALVFLFNVAYQAGPFRPASQRLGLDAAMRMSVYPALAVLVVACPCALVLATPAAIVAALGRLAGTGVLLKSGASLEKLASIKKFAFDKTGTLTEGRLELGDLIPLQGTAEELLQAAAAAERGSEHPLGQLVVQAANERGLPIEEVEQFQARPGGGVMALWHGTRLIVGTRRLLEEEGIPLTPEAEAALARLDESGQSAFLVACGDEILGAMGARDRLRPDAADMIAELRLSGIDEIRILTGDRPAPARNIAEAVNVGTLYAGLLPEQKAELIDRDTCFVGDGINDAPALARAGIGIAVGSGTDIAGEAGDIIMMGEPLKHLPFLTRLSRETVKVIRQNLWWFAFGVNIVGVIFTGILWPLFAPSAEWYERAPLIGVLYHQAGSLLVLLNSMRLLGFERRLSSPTYVRARNRFRDFDQWLGSIHLDDLFHWISHHLRPLGFAAAALALLAFAASGLTQIGPDEVGVVQRFGQVTAELPPGLHLRWPNGIEQVTRIKPDQVRVVEVGFRSGTSDGGLTWTSAHGEGYRRIADESLMITGDGNLVEISASVRYSIADAKAYLFSAQRIDSLIRSATEAALREAVTSRPFQQMLTTGRADLQRDAFQSLQQRFEQIAPEKAGVRFDGLTIHDLHPPPEVVVAYHDVARAIQARDEQINKAKAQATIILKQADEEAFRELADAEAAKHDKIEIAKAGRDAFLFWHRLRSNLPPDLQSKLTDPAARQEALEQRKRLTESRLTWEVLVEVMRGRDKIIIDGDVPRGRRNLYLVDPDFLRPTLTLPKANLPETPGAP
jgi:Cu+-exporting ATPase